MFTKKTFLALALTLILVALPLASAYAAPATQTTTVDCTVQSISTSTDATTGVTTVQVTCADGTTATLTSDEALALGLVTQNPDGTFTVNDAAIGTVIQVTPTEVVDPCAAPTTSDTTGGTTTTTTTTTTGEESTGGSTSLNPVGQALCEFFGLDYQTIQDANVGYGVIAQACFMAQLLGDDCAAVLEAKSSGDYSAFGDGITNWGQLRKAVFGELLSKGEQSSCNLGAIMSGRDADPSACGGTASPASTSTNDHGKGNHGNNGGRGNHGKP